MNYNNSRQTNGNECWNAKNDSFVTQILRQCYWDSVHINVGIYKNRFWNDNKA